MNERLQVHPYCLMFFVDESGHEEFADPNYPIYALGGCAVMASAVDQVIKQPWRAMKAQHFGGADVPLHASDVRNPSVDQLKALEDFFKNQPFGRFAATMRKGGELPRGYKPLDVMPGVLRKRWEELTSRCSPTPVEFAFLHEASERGDPLIEKYFGPTIMHIEGKQIPAHQGFMTKSSDEALEVADFIAQAAGLQAHRWANGNRSFRKDFQAIFHVNEQWSSFHAVERVTVDG